MMVAAVVTVVFHKLRQPVVLGYILAGFIVGPHTPPASLIHDEGSIKTLAELGIVFLMFSLGLEFSLRKLQRVGASAFITAFLEILLMVWVGYEIGRMFGWKRMDCVFLGAMLSISSTTIIVKALHELGLSKERSSELIFGVLIIEDILAIVMIALLSGIAMTGSVSVADVVNTSGRLAIFLVVALVVGLLAVPRLLGVVGGFRSNEVLLVTVLGLCFGVAFLAVKLGYSVALGAFVIGAVIAEAREIGRVETLTEPLRDMFSAVFFVTIGMMIEPRLLWEYAGPIVVITLAVVVGKVVMCAFGSYISGNNTRTSLRVGMGLAQIGEFSFIIASLGLDLGVTSKFLYPIAVTVSAITTLVTPYLIGSSDRMVRWFDRVAPSALVNYLSLYTAWVGRWREGKHTSMATRLMRRWAGQMALNLALTGGVFLSAAFLARKHPEWLAAVFGGESTLKPFLWLCAMIVSLPCLIATYRKMQALGMMLGEMAAADLKKETLGSGVKAIVSNTVGLAGVLGMALLVLVLSSTILPSGNLLAFLLLLVAAVVGVFWRGLIRIHAKAQIALHETFAQPGPSRHTDQSVSLAGLLREAVIERFEISAASPACGRLIRELALRTVTGASVVAIDRGGVSLVNPGPDEELVEGDHVLLLGKPVQLEKARELFEAKP